MNKRKIFEVVVLFILSLLPLIWFHDNTLLLGHDSGFRLNPNNHLYNLFYSWNTSANFGSDWTIFKGFLVTQFPEFFFTYITNSIYWGQKLTLIFWFFSMAISMYIFLNEFFKEGKYWFLRLFSSLFYVYNFFILQAWFIAERSKFSVYAALPLGFLILYKTLTRRISLIRGSIYFALIFFFFNGGGNIPVFGGLLITYTILLLSFVAEKLYKKQFTEIIFIGKISMFFLFSAVMINFYWFLPQIFLAVTSYSTKLSVNGGVGGILNWEGVISKNASLLNLFRFQGVPDWYDNPFHAFSQYYLNSNLLIVASCLPFLVILLGIVFKKFDGDTTYRVKLIKIISVVFIIGFLFNGGTHPPLGFMYEWLLTHIPGFAIFRSSYYKFSPAVFFSSAILCGYFINVFLVHFIKNIKLLVIAGSLIIIGLLTYHFSYFSANFFTFSAPFTTKIKLPDYVQKTFAYINIHVDPNASILLAPELDSTIGEDSYTWGYWSLDFLPRIALKNPVIASDANTPIIKDLYKSLHNGDEKLFISLAQKAGIHYILWRDDILHNDKITNAKFLQDEKKHLDSFPSLQVKFSSGKWKLYSIPQTTPLFTVTPYIYMVDTETPNFGDLVNLAQTPLEKTSWIIAPQSNNKKISGTIFENSCQTCNVGSLEDQSQQLTISAVKILPWSKFYFLITWRENKQLEQTASLPGQRIDVDMSLSNKRISEMWEMGYHFFSEKTPSFSIANEKKYENLVNDAIEKIDSLENNDKTQYQGRIIAYLTYQKNYLQPSLQNNQIKPAVGKMLSFIEEKIAFLNQQIWISPSNSDRKSYITVPYTGNYTASVLSDGTSPYVLFIDNKAIDTTKEFSLSKGTHTTEVKYLSLPNVIAVDNAANTIDIKNEPVKYTLNNFSSNLSYTIHFNYSIKSKVTVAVYQNTSTHQFNGIQMYPLKVGLINDGKEHSFTYHYIPSTGSDDATILFTSDKNSSIHLSDFTVEETTNPRIYLTQISPIHAEGNPQVSYTKLNSGLYIVSIKNATDPYWLTFNQSFSSGWNVRLQNGFDKLNAQHVEINGYGNGWFVNRKGNYNIIIEYNPQNYFYLGSLIIMVVMVFCGIIYGLKNKKKNL